MIKKVIIENFRTIKNIELNFNDINAIVGSNNVGKTTILQAINNVLNESYILSKFKINDFHDRDNNKIIITIHLTKPILGRKLRSVKDNEHYDIEIEKFVFEISKNDQELEYVFRVYGENNKEFYGNNAIRKKINFIYIPANRDLKQQMYTNRSAIWGKILDKLNNSITFDQESTQKFTNSMETSTSILEENSIYKQFKKTLLKNIDKNTKGLNDKINISFKTYDPSEYFKTLNIFGDIKKEPTLNIVKLGYGTQNLISITLFQTYAEIFQKALIIAIEEPESFLDPHTQRMLFNNLKKSSTMNIQIIYSTHSTHFVEPEMGPKIIMLRRIDNETHMIKIPDSDKLSKLINNNKYKIYTHFNPERNELFFAKKILLVEGDSDKILFETLCRQHWNINLEEMGISIIECGGKRGVSYFLGVCNLIGLTNYFAIWDEDDELDTIEYLEHALEINKGFVMKPNLEKYLKILGSEKKKIQNAYEWALSDKYKQSLELDSIKSFLNNN